MTFFSDTSSKHSKSTIDSSSDEVVEQITEHLAPLVKTPLSLLDSLGTFEDVIQPSKPVNTKKNHKKNG